MTDPLVPLRLAVPDGFDFPEDVDRLVRVFAERGFRVTRNDVASAYAVWSEENYCAGWLCMPLNGKAGDDWLFKNIRRMFVEDVT